MTILPPYDGSMPFDIWKWTRERELKHLAARESSLLRAKNAAGQDLYRITSGGNLHRVFPLSPTTRRAVIERDKACVWCGAGAPFEVDHIIRYIDNGSNDASNLQALCEPCHRSKGGK